MGTTINTTALTYKQDWQRRFGTTVANNLIIQDCADAMRHLYVSGINEANRQSELITALVLQHLLAGHSAFLFEAQPIVRELLSQQKPLLEELNLEVVEFDLIDDGSGDNDRLEDFSTNMLPTLVEKTFSSTVIVSIVVDQKLLPVHGQAIFNAFWQLYYTHKTAYLENTPITEQEDLKATLGVLSPFDQFITTEAEMEDILAEARIRNLAMILNHDNPAELTNECLERVLVSTASQIIFRQTISPNLDFLAHIIASNLWWRKKETALADLGLITNSTSEDELELEVGKLLEQLPPNQAFGQILFKNSHQPYVLFKPDALS